VAAVGGIAAVKISSPQAGIATIQVYEQARPSNSDSVQFAVTLPNSAANFLTLQSSANIIKPSVPGSNQTVTLTATVWDGLNPNRQAVANAPVAFKISNPTGGGESISPAIVLTDAAGVATATFTSGSLSSGAQGIKVTAVEVKNVDLPQEMLRAIAKQAEAERMRRAKIINAEGEFQAAQKLADAAKIISTEPATLQLRFLQTLVEVASDRSSTILFPLPLDLIRPFLEAKGSNVEDK